MCDKLELKIPIKVVVPPQHKAKFYISSPKNRLLRFATHFKQKTL
jgi:hypothetical protein